jgi:DNA modification methylase/transcription elongation factor Elf1
MADLFSKPQKASGPVDCLGNQFPSEQARRDHFIKRLAEKLKDPAFRKAEGFPTGTDEAILALSDPPYYTACPNPFIDEFIAHYGRQYNSAEPYQRAPFAADVSEGKYDPLYKLHPYHTKVPHRAIMRYILQYTSPGDVMLDAFAGTGASAVAAQLCGNKQVVESLGYKVDTDGAIYREELEDGKKLWKKFSALGIRNILVSDLSPIASFIAYTYNTPVDSYEFQKNAHEILRDIESKYGWMFQTLHNGTTTQVNEAKNTIELGDGLQWSTGKSIGKVVSTIWSDVFTCPECAGSLIFWHTAVDIENGKVNESFPCTHCGTSLTKKSLQKKMQKVFDPYLQKIIDQSTQVPVLINYKVGKKRFNKVPDAADLALIKKTDELKSDEWMPTFRMMNGGETRRNDPAGITHVHHFYTGRNRTALAAFNAKCGTPLLRSLVTTVAFRITKRYGLTYQAGTWGAGGGPTSGTLYIPSLVKELNMFEMIENAISKVDAKQDIKNRNAIISTQACQGFKLPKNSLDYVFIDPPFGANIMYAELNFLWEAWLGVLTEEKFETIESKSQNKRLDDYRRLMTDALRRIFEALKPGRWITVEFSNTQASVWNAIQTALQEAGFVVANVAALDKQKGSFVAITTTTAVKQDLVISAYKPGDDLEEALNRSGSSESSVWEFTRAHLKHLPAPSIEAGALGFVKERDPRIIFDRMVSWFVRHGIPVPLSSQEFQAGLTQRFTGRDGMIFSTDEAAEYDKKRARVSGAPQMEMFVADERSAIDWLTDFIKGKPATYQEIHPEFISQLGAGWKRHEAKPELFSLLEANFIQYDGVGDVPSQIHGYLSSNFKDLRGLEKSALQLVAKAKDRWYVPDPNKAHDLEKKRERSLLKEFEAYQTFTGRKLKEFRLEVLRAGFKAAWTAKNYKAIIAIAQKIPEEALQEDEKLLLWYDQALTRTEAGA